jgi:hypothetical protein
MFSHKKAHKHKCILIVGRSISLPISGYVPFVPFCGLIFLDLLCGAWLDYAFC